MAHLIGCEHSSDCIIEPIWLYRILPLLALVALVLAETVAVNHDFLRNIFLGAASGLLVGACVAAFGAKAIPSREPKPSSVVRRYPVT
jgi:hypothetical protein